MRQYRQAKRQNPEALLLFRLGDFYELFFADAVTAAQALQITLTSRNKEKGEPIPMCGVPYHAAQGYIARLLEQGHKVALCEQMEDPRQAKALVRREVTRVLTPGTAGLAAGEGENAYLAAVARGGGAVGLAWLDLSTGEFRATEFSGAEAEARLEEELAQGRPRELLLAASERLGEPPRREERTGATLTRLEEWRLQPEFGRGVLESHFGVLSLEAFGVEGKPWAQAAAGAIVHYARETQRSPLAHVDRLGFYERQQGLVLDAVTVRNLELVEPLFQSTSAATLRAVMDHAVTPMGKRLLRQWLLRPAKDAAEIEARLEAVETLVSDWERREQLRRLAAGVEDLERLLARVGLATAGPRELVALGASLERVPGLKARLQAAPAARLQALSAEMDGCAELCQAIAEHLVAAPPAGLVEGGYIRAGVSAELDELRALSHGAKAALAAIEQRERTRTGIGSLKLRYHQVFGYHLEVTRTNLARVPQEYQRLQTLANAERFTLPELKSLEAKILGAEERSRLLERELFEQLRQRAAAVAAPVRRNAAAIAALDVLANFAQLAAERNYCRPEVGAAGFDIRGGRHPVVERLGEDGGERFVPNDLALDAERQRVLLITGPNMGGKSTYLRQAALISILAQMGSFVPATSARLPLLERIFTRIGAGDNLARGRSTFMVEMTEAAAILNQADERSLVLLDEIGRGTATYDGLALAWAMVEQLHGHNRAFTLFATHYHELTELARHLPGVANAQVRVEETGAGDGRGIVFLRRVEAGAASRSYGLEVARLAGVPRAVVDRARQVLRQQEQAGARTSLELEAPAEARLQLTLFTPLSQQVAQRLRAAELERLTPLEALNLLAELQQSLRGEG